MKVVVEVVDAAPVGGGADHREDGYQGDGEGQE